MSELIKVVEPCIDKVIGGVELEILNGVHLVNAPHSALFDYAREMENKRLTNTASSCNIELRPSEELVLEIMEGSEHRFYHLEDYYKEEQILPEAGKTPTTARCKTKRELVNIERFLIDSSSKLHIVQRSERTHHLATVTMTYVTDAMMKLQTIDREIPVLQRFNFSTKEMVTMRASFSDRCIVRWDFENTHPIQRKKIKYRYADGVDVNTAVASVSRDYDEAFYRLSRYLQGWVISHDLKTMSLKLTIDPTWSIQIPNPWMVKDSTYGIRDVVDLYQIARKYTELYKMNRLLFRVIGTKAVDLQMARMFDIGQYYDGADSKHIRDPIIRKINDAYRRVGLHQLITATLDSSKRSTHPTAGAYIDFKN